MAKIVEIYHDAETDEFTVITDDFDDFFTFDEQEAMDEAQSRADEIGGIVKRY